LLPKRKEGKGPTRLPSMRKKKGDIGCREKKKSGGFRKKGKVPVHRSGWKEANPRRGPRIGSLAGDGPWKSQFPKSFNWGKRKKKEKSLTASPRGGSVTLPFSLVRMRRGGSLVRPKVEKKGWPTSPKEKKEKGGGLMLNGGK